MSTDQEKKRRNIVLLPEDLLVEILSRVPEASLARFRSTSKVWNALIKKDARLDKKSLVAMLLDHRVYLARLDLHDDNVVKVISQFGLNDPFSNSSEELDIRDVFHCDGLLLCTTMDERLVVWNPCSGDTIRTIKPMDSYYNFDTYYLGKSSCNKYKILRVHHNGHGYFQPYQIYDFTTNLWRDVGESSAWSIPGHLRQGTSVDGNTYWLTYTNRNALQCFDYSTERFGPVSFPVDPLSHHAFSLSVTREEQKLCLITSCAKLLDIGVWMATKIKGTGDMSWSKLLTVKRTSSCQFMTLLSGMSFSVDREAKVLVCPTTRYDDSSNLLHIVGEDKYIKVDHHDVGSKSSLPFRCHPILVQIQQGCLGLGTWKAAIK